MTANAVLALAQLAFSDVTLGGFLPLFWDTASGTVPVAELAVENGRYTEIFDQPPRQGSPMAWRCSASSTSSGAACGAR